MKNAIDTTIKVFNKINEIEFFKLLSLHFLTDCHLKFQIDNTENIQHWKSAIICLHS